MDLTASCSPVMRCARPTRHASRVTALPLALCVAALVPLSALASDRLPQRAPGQWELSMDNAAMPGGSMTLQQCVDERSDEEAQRRALGGDPSSRCTTRNVRTGPGGYEADYACDGAGGKVTGRVKATGDMKTGYTLVNTMRRERADKGPADITLTIRARHLGACPADLKPGETRIAGMPGMPAGMPPMPAMPAGGAGNMSPEQLRQMMEQFKRGTTGR